MSNFEVVTRSNKILPNILEAPPESKPYEPFGASREVFRLHDPEFIIDGPAGTGKSRGCLEKLYICGLKYPGMRGLMVRKTRESLTQSGMVTFEKHVVPSNGTVRWRTQEQHYEFSNGSVLVVGGLDKSSKIMSTDYDIIYVQEATEATQEDWEDLTTRARNGVMPYNQVFGDCNPGPSSHWILNRRDQGTLKLLQSRHEDNPILFDHKTNTWTARGLAYLAKLDNLSGVRYKRLRLGMWVSAEGLVYDEYDPAIHLVDRFKIPPEWRRFIAVDFGYTNPFVAQWWAISPDDNMYRYREIYMTRRTVKVHAEKILKLTGEEQIEAWVCDWDAEDRATLEENGIGPTIPAEKAVTVGIQAVKDRLKARSLFLMRDSLVETDHDLVENYSPVNTEGEFETYVWSDKNKKEIPVKKDDHGMDPTRYATMYANSYDRKHGGIYV